MRTQAVHLLDSGRRHRAFVDPWARWLLPGQPAEVVALVTPGYPGRTVSSQKGRIGSAAGARHQPTGMNAVEWA